ncbi:MAG: flagellar hook-basal body complex protein [Pseudomonadota bacterium]
MSESVGGGAGAISKTQTAGLVTAFSRATNEEQGDILAGQSDTSIAIDGDGYFVIQEAVGQTDGQTVFSGVDLYTRRGDFSIDKDGFLVNGSGYYLKGFDVDPTTGNIVGSTPEVIQVQDDFLPATATTTITYQGNLPETPATSTALIDVANVLGAGGGAGTAADSVQFQHQTTFLEQSISGGSVTTYDANGTPINVTFRWAKVDDIDTGAADQWRLFYQSDSTTTTAAATTWTNTGLDYTFDASGNLLTPAGGTSTITGLTVDGQSLGNVTFTHGTDGLTQTARASGTFDDNGISHNGFPSGELQQIRFGAGGQINATYTNGRTITIAEIPVVAFNADSALTRLDGGAFAQTAESGPPQFGTTAAIVGNALEASNTDIADEFSKLIITQQAYTANTRIVTTADEMLSETLNIIR